MIEELLLGLFNLAVSFDEYTVGVFGRYEL